MATQSRIGWRPYVTQVVNAVDADATAFIAAAGITDLTQAAAVSTLVNDLKTYGLWTKMKALYPMVGGSATSHKFNLKDPRDLDAAYRLVFNGGWVHSSNGAKPNGTTGYANTFLIPSSNYPTTWDISMGFYSRTNIAEASNDLGTYQTNTQCLAIQTRWSGAGGSVDTIYSQVYADISPYNIVVPNTNSSGLFTLTRTSTTSLKQFRNTTILGSSTSTMYGSIPSTPISISNSGVGGGLFSTREQAFTFIGNGLTDTDTSNLYISVQKFQTTLGRHVGTPYVSDPDAITFLMAAGITDGTQAAAINTLVIRMKADGVWTKMKAIYPFVGGTATSHKFNLKDPRDIDAAYRLVFNGGWTHTGTGALPNGTTGYADTKLKPSTDLNINEGSLGFYSRTNNSGRNSAEMGSITTNPNPEVYFQIHSRMADNRWYVLPNTTGTLSHLLTTTDSIGFYQGSRLSSTSIIQFKNNISSTENVPYVSPTTNVLIGARTQNGLPAYFSDRECGFAYIGNSISTLDITNFYNAVQAYQTTLGRQVNIPVVSDTDAQTFLNAANITSFQQASAVNKLVIDLKAAGVWIKMKAIYPFVGGNATSHKFNLKDPRDLDAAYRLTFSGGMTHSSTGVLFGGANGYADTKFIMNQVYASSVTNIHVSYYSRTNSINDIMIGMQDDSVGQGSQIYLTDTGTAQIYSALNTDSNWVRSNNSSPSIGFYLVSRTSMNLLKGYKNGISVGSNTTTSNSSNLKSTLPLLLGAQIYKLSSTSYYYGNKESSFATIGDGLTDAEASALYNSIQTYQTSLGRSVNTPVYNNGLVLNLDAGNANSYPGTGTTWFDLAAGNNGTLVNGPTYDTTNGESILFDGVNDYVDLGSNFRFNDSDITYDFWFKSTDNSDVYHEIITLGSSNQSNVLSLWKYRSGSNSGKVFIAIYVAGFAQTLASSQLTGADILNTIVNYTAVFKKESGVYKLYLYRNGILDVSATSNVTSYNMNNWSNFEARIGSGSSTYPELWKGNIYSGKVWSRALSATEILNNFNSTRGRFGI